MCVDIISPSLMCLATQHRQLCCTPSLPRWHLQFVFDRQLLYSFSPAYVVLVCLPITLFLSPNHSQAPFFISTETTPNMFVSHLLCRVHVRLLSRPIVPHSMHQARKEAWGGPGWSIDSAGSGGAKTPRGSPNSGGSGGGATSSSVEAPEEVHERWVRNFPPDEESFQNFLVGVGLCTRALSEKADEAGG